MAASDSQATSELTIPWGRETLSPKAAVQKTLRINSWLEPTNRRAVQTRARRWGSSRQHRTQARPEEYKEDVPSGDVLKKKGLQCNKMKN